MSETNELSGLALRHEIATKLMGEELWVEKRGDYSSCTAHRPRRKGEKPWERTQKAYQKPERYRTGTVADINELGFFGTGYPAYESDPAACAAMEARIKELGLEREYTVELRLECAPRMVMAYEPLDILMACIFATPEQRCRAALATVESQQPTAQAEQATEPQR